VGNTNYGRVPDVAPKPEAVRPYKAKEYAPVYQVTEPPSYLDNVSPEEMRKLYPEDARKAELEAQVRVKLVVDDDGTVAKAELLDKPGHGFAEAALKVARLLRFRPAKVNGRAVATEIPSFTINFELAF